MKNLMPYFAIMVVSTLFSLPTFAQNSYSIELTFVDHLKAGLIEQDVFVKKEDSKNKVYRVLPAEREDYLNAELYTTKNTVSHEPFDGSKAGPYKKGESLDITLNDWLQAKGTATCTCEGGWGTVKASFENLMPNALYTIWHSFMAKDNAENFIGTFDLPLGNRDGSQAEFRTDKNGKAHIDVRFEHCLQLSESQLMGMLAIDWHSDDNTYGIDPGPFGKGAHIQLFAPLPDFTDVIAKNKDEATSSNSGK